MRPSNLCTMVILTILTNQVLCVQQDYYWREYTGNIPGDAVSAGNDINGKPTYIGQAYVKNLGLIVGQIYPGIKQVEVPIYGIKKIDKNIKILCGPTENFVWMTSNNTNLHLDLIGKTPVIGGHNDAYGYLNIGRISHEAEIRIGKVDAFTIGDARMYFSNKGSEDSSKTYEVLCYVDSIIIDPRIN